MTRKHHPRYLRRRPAAGAGRASARDQGVDIKAGPPEFPQPNSAAASELAMDWANTVADAGSVYVAELDVLTGLPGRALMHDRLAQARACADRHGKRLAVMFIDLDHFRHLNDTLGREVGDRLLQSVARRLISTLRHSDSVGRLGGDEFVVLLAEIDAAKDAEVAAEKLQQILSVPHLIDDHRLYVTPSIGIACYPDDGRDIPSLVSHAALAMQQAKKHGRNSYLLFAPEMKDHPAHWQSDDCALLEALQAEDFVLHYQARVNLASGRVSGVEVLLRLQGPEQVLIYPAQFLPQVEDRTLMFSIGQWVLRTACQQASTWRAAGWDIGCLSVNVSMLEFHSNDFLAMLRTTLHETGWPAQSLELELAEHCLLGDYRLSKDLLLALKNLGLRIAIDDFGIGQAGLSSIARFPVDTLKIDRSFAPGIDAEDAPGAGMMSAMIAMGKGLHRRVVAEGVETPGQLAFLKLHQCDEAQGNVFCPPLPADDFARFMAGRQNARQGAAGL